jgi:hypothetical protein
MKLTGLGLFILALPLFASAQTPTLVQHASCPNSRNSGGAQSSTPVYKCPLPEPSQGGNTLIAAVVSYSGSTYTMSDDQSNSWTLVNSLTNSGNNDYVAIYVASNVKSGTRMVSLQRNPGTDNVAISVSEYYNVGVVDVSSCHIGSSSSTTITAGSVTPTISGDLLWQWAVSPTGGGALPSSVSSFAAGSQPNISWQLNGTDLYDGDAVQAGVYNATTAINPSFTTGTSLFFDSCAVALKAASAGTAPTQAFRIIHMLHQQHPKSAANPFPIQFPTSGNLIVTSYISGGSNISSVSSSPSNTWSSTGTPAGSEGVTALSQIYYAANAATANNMTVSFTRNDNTSDGTLMMYDFTGASATPFDKDSGGQTGNQTSQVGSFATCNGCLTPSAANEVIIANAGWNWCTGNGVSAPSGALFDPATDTGNSVNGPESVDQNNGWMHYYDSGASAITVTWSPMSCSQAEGEWAGRVAAFSAGSSVSQQPAPPTGLTVVVN